MAKKIIQKNIKESSWVGILADKWSDSLSEKGMSKQNPEWPEALKAGKICKNDPGRMNYHKDSSEGHTLWVEDITNCLGSLE